MPRTVNKYSYPVDFDAITMAVDKTSSDSHEGPYRGSIDFAVPLETTVYAGAAGVVQRVRDDSDRHGKTSDFGPDVNYITIEHAHSELSEYLHLAKGSALVKVGDKVTRGQAIAKTGLSGWLYAPHLHFMVYKNGQEFRCLDITFI